MDTFNSIEKSVTKKETEDNPEISDEFKVIKKQIEDINIVSDNEVIKSIEIFMMNGENDKEEINKLFDLLNEKRPRACEIIFSKAA